MGRFKRLPPVVGGPPVHETVANGVAVVRTPTGIAVACTSDPSRRADDLLTIELVYDGRLFKREVVRLSNLPWRDYVSGVDMLRVAVRVSAGPVLLAELEPPPGTPLPFMVRQGDQQHVTEDYVSVPPALTITDERGDVWTLGFEVAPEHLAPAGEYAFPVLRNGVRAGEIASRIERKNGKTRVLTAAGWRVWNGRFFF